MNINQLKPASALAQQYGVKCLAYGGPGTAKTPTVKTAPNPVMCVIEPGMLSMRDATNIPAFQAHTPELIEEFFTWLFQSAEAKQFDTVCIDSISELAEVFLKREMKNHSHGLKAYGEMSTKVMDLVTGLYYMQEKHIYIIAKLGFREESGVNTKVPYFPGKDLNTKVPHLYDELLYFGPENINNQPQLAIRTKEKYGVKARDRSGKLDELEPLDLSHIFNKCMS